MVGIEQRAFSASSAARSISDLICPRSGVGNYALIVPYPGPAVGRMRKQLMNLQVEESDAIRQRIRRIGQLPRPQLRHYVLANSGVAYRIAPVDQSLLVRVADRRKTSG